MQIESYTIISKLSQNELDMKQERQDLLLYY